MHAFDLSFDETFIIAGLVDDSSGISRLIKVHTANGSTSVIKTSGNPENYYYV